MTSFVSKIKSAGRGMVGYLRSSSGVRTVTPSRLQMGLFFFFLVCGIIISLSNYDQFQLGGYMDDASYAVLAKSLVFSDTYGLMNTPGQAIPTRFPFGYPLILSAIVRLFPSSIEMLKFASLFATALNAFLIFLGWPYLSQNKSFWWGLCISVLYCLSPLVIAHSRMVMSEPIFTALILVTLVLTEKILIQNNIRTNPTILIGMVMALTLFTRSIGIVLIVAVVARLLSIPLDRSIKQKKILVLAAGGFLLVAAVAALTPVNFRSLFPGEYIDQMANPSDWGQSKVETQYGPRFVGGFQEYIQQHLRLAVIPVGGGSSELEFGKKLGISNLPLLTSLLIGCLIVVGNLSLFQGQGLSPTVFLFQILYLMAVFLWPWRGPRFLYPILPFLLYTFLWGIKIIAAFFDQLGPVRMGGRPVAVLSTLAAFMVAFGLLSLSIYKGISDKSTSLQYVRDLRLGAMWIKENSAADALIMAQQPQSIYIYSGRNTIDFPGAFTASYQFEKLIGDQGVDYLIIAPELAWREDGQLAYDEFTSGTLLPTVNDLQKRGVIEEVYRSEPDMVVVYQVREP